MKERLMAGVIVIVCLVAVLALLSHVKHAEAETIDFVRSNSTHGDGN